MQSRRGRCFLVRPECADLFHTIYLSTKVTKRPKPRLFMQPCSVTSSVSDKRLALLIVRFFAGKCISHYFSNVTACLDSVTVLNIVCFSAAVFQNSVCWKCHGKFGAIFQDNHVQVSKLGQQAENNRIAAIQKARQEIKCADRREIGRYSR